VIFVKGMMNGLIAVIALVLTAVSFWQYRASPANTMWLIGVIVFLLVTLVFGGLFLSGRVNRNDDVHITE
jgi:ABC-type multidrug transport system permease subunit